ncbi:flavin reductase [Micromonospora sp. RP3T]|uniref:flavin reductase n=1 Tax=Micromonospora sp. RP3T TaxID=2135446 RepID=UPI000D156B9F|nr:flavin reductase [Micromonospora sp. RP3T]PTA43725.1 flavin reductase [Micromonospora sp. RP3T]
MSHVARRPAWHCDTCDQSWPCDAARRTLLAEYGDDRLALAVYLAALQAEAAGQLVGEDPLTLRARFLGWTRRGGSPRTSPSPSS